MKPGSKTAVRQTSGFARAFHLPFLDRVHYLDATQNEARAVEVLEPQHRSGSAFNGRT
jgi:hypothetical protein